MNYATSAKVWRHPLNGSECVEIPVQVEFLAKVPVLITGVRVLEYCEFIKELRRQLLG